MKTRHNPLQALLSRAGNGDDFEDITFATAIFQGDDPDRRACSWYGTGSYRTLIYSTPQPDLRRVPAGAKVLILDSREDDS